MNNQSHTRDDLITAVQSLTGQANMLTIPRELSRFLGDDLPAALLLSQLIYWQGKQERADGAIYKTYSEWYEETGLTEYQVRRATKKMSEFLRTEIHRAEGSPTVHYYLDTGKFSVWFLEFLKDRNRSFSRIETEVSQDSLTETTTKTTTKTTPSLSEKDEETLISDNNGDNEESTDQGNAEAIWSAALAEIKGEVNNGNFRTYFVNTVGLDCQNGTITIGVPAEWVAENLQLSQRSLIKRVLIKVAKKNLTPVFRVLAEAEPAPLLGRTKGYSADELRRGLSPSRMGPYTKPEDHRIPEPE
ncbi:hypothetical protein ES705_18595 [subsurface metagenome]